MMVSLRRGNNGKCRGKKFFARAKGDVRQKCSGGYSLPMADVRAKNISPLQTDDWGCNGVCVYLDDRQRPGRRSGDGVPSANVGAKYLSPVPQMMRGRNSYGYPPPMADVWAKNISPLQMDDRVCEKVCVYLDDRQRPGRRSGDGVSSPNVGAKNISPMPKKK